MNIGDLKVGHTVICANEDGWGGDFEKGKRYRVTRIDDVGIVLNGMHVASGFLDDFVRDPLDLFCVDSLKIVDVDSEGSGDGELHGYAIKNADTGHMTSIWENSDDPAEQMLFQLINSGLV